MRRVRVLVVDDHQMLREALVGMLELSGFEVVGAVADGADATSLAVELTPTWSCWTCPCRSSTAWTRPGCCAPETAVVMFSAFDSPELRREAFAAGAVASLPKGCSNHRLRATLEAAITVAGSDLRRA